ncbi:MAG TPA: AzlC family ABC transporter permease [Pseudolysinimonas sp.]|nr:AzlC family ABC transporter permease [Pseudolysinimonas sp.]
MASSNPARAADPERSAAVRASLAVGLAVSAYGLSFGALAVASGLDIWQTQVLSLFMFSGGSQFAVIGVLASGGVAAGPAAIAGAALLGVRNSLYSMRMAPIVGGPATPRGWARRLLAGQWTIDESTAVSTAQPTLRGQRIGFWMTGAVIYVGWNLTTLLGSLLGNLIGDVRMFGLDAAAAAAFLGLLWPRLTSRQPIAVAAGAAVVAAVLIPWLPAGLPVLIAALVAVAVGFTNWLGRTPAVGTSE